MKRLQPFYILSAFLVLFVTGIAQNINFNTQKKLVFEQERTSFESWTNAIFG